MDIFRETNKLSVTTAVLAVMTIVLAYLGAIIQDPVNSFEFSMLAIFSVILFFFSLNRDKARSGSNAPG
jgi:hypothetical protein